VAAVPEQATTFDQVAFLTGGSVLDEGEALDSDRLRGAAGPMLMQTFHIAYELGGEQAVEALPGGPQWLAVIQAIPERERHLAVHTGHLLHLNDADTAAWNAGAHTLLEHATLTGTASQVRTRVEDLSGAGVTEIVYQPTGDIPRELEFFANAMGLPSKAEASR
jgi:5,10-methylenetetrahydromethanopterin reductase